MSTKHAPLPWQPDLKPLAPPDFPEPFLRGYRGSNGQAIPVFGFALSRSGEALTNAALIVRAVNSHAALVDALQDWLAYAEENLREFDDDACDRVDDLCPKCRSSGCINWKILNARAALLAATEGRITSGEPQQNAEAIVPNQQDDGSKG